MLLPTTHAAVRTRLDQWFEREGIRPRVVGEFEDSALLKTFGASGMGVFPAVELVHDDLVERYGVKRVGPCPGVEEHFFAIGTENWVWHAWCSACCQRGEPEPTWVGAGAPCRARIDGGQGRGAPARA